MCTAISYTTDEHYFGRTLDNDCSYGEQITVTPRNFTFTFRESKALQNHYAIIGMAYTVDNFPLYYDAVNEKGLCIAALRFARSAYYSKSMHGKYNIASFELIPWLLGKCETVESACELMKNTQITSTAFSDELPPSPLHWIISDRTRSAVIEATVHGINIYDNPIGVLTNEPPFPEQLSRLNDYINLSPDTPKNRFAPDIQLTEYSRGLGAIGLPGDLSSASRFARAAFFKLNSVSIKGEENSVAQFFHLLDTVSQPRGACRTENGKHEITVYSSCCNATKGIYYYTTYDNRTITAVNMHAVPLDSSNLTHFPLINEVQIMRQN